MVGTKGVGSQPFATLRWETDFESVFQVIQGILGRGTPWWSSRPPGWGDAGTGSFHIYRTWSLWWGDCKVPVKSSSFWTILRTWKSFERHNTYRSNNFGYVSLQLGVRWAEFHLHTRSIGLEARWWETLKCWWVMLSSAWRTDDLESLDALTPVEVMTWRRIVPIGDCYELNFQDNWELYGMEITWSLTMLGISSALIRGVSQTRWWKNLWGIILL